MPLHTRLHLGVTAWWALCVGHSTAWSRVRSHSQHLPQGLWEGKGHALLSPILYSTLFGGQEVSQLDLRTWDQAWGEATALQISVSSRLGVASSVFCTMRVMWKLLARDPLLDRINAGDALLLCEDYRSQQWLSGW